MKTKIHIYTDGACRNNQSRENIGAWAYIITDNFDIELDSKACKNTTNNIMELTAVIEALKFLINHDYKPYAHDVTIYSDSTYVVYGLTLWHPGWINKNWKDVKNADLWKELLKLTTHFPALHVKHVKGHANNQLNIEVDRLCNKAMDKGV